MSTVTDAIFYLNHLARVSTTASQLCHQRARIQQERSLFCLLWGEKQGRSRQNNKDGVSAFALWLERKCANKAVLQSGARILVTDRSPPPPIRRSQTVSGGKEEITSYSQEMQKARSPNATEPAHFSHSAQKITQRVEEAKVLCVGTSSSY